KHPVVIRGTPPPNELLLNLVSDDSDVRESAVRALFSVFWHQGTIYEATAAAVPFVCGLVADGACAERASLTEWLLTVAGSCTAGTSDRDAACDATWCSFRESRTFLERACEEGTEAERAVFRRIVAELHREEGPAAGVFDDPAT